MAETPLDQEYEYPGLPFETAVTQTLPLLKPQEEGEELVEIAMAAGSVMVIVETFVLGPEAQPLLATPETVTV